MISLKEKEEDFSIRIKERAIVEGFAVSGIASIKKSSRLKLRNNALERWLENGYHSDMKWMEAEKRKNIESLLKGAKSILSVGFNYLSKDHKQNTKFKIGKFGQGEDYHKIIYKKLKNLGKWLDNEIPNCKWKICVDTSPLLEKAWAEEAGLGWISKNSNLINTDYGSWMTLGFMILTKDLTPDNPSKSLCGRCEKCIEQCPTNAITEPFVINSNLCIAYHTIENRNKKLPEQIEQNLNGWIAGCDICQDVCPWNKSVPFNDSIEAAPKSWLEKLDAESLSWKEEEWNTKLRGSTLRRIKPWMWKRNIRAIIKKY
ncbi:tRNA epoxyqueuosine(34) reductase QueG [Prochlorococcus sp. AH-716-K03]|nr:tRNA epoxyqueuosine(34) reductase QueG [Prochlorococcus sp. AH-716-K03]